MLLNELSTALEDLGHCEQKHAHLFQSIFVQSPLSATGSRVDWFVEQGQEAAGAEGMSLNNTLPCAYRVRVGNI